MSPGIFSPKYDPELDSSTGMEPVPGPGITPLLLSFVFSWLPPANFTHPVDPGTQGIIVWKTYPFSTFESFTGLSVGLLV